MIKIEIKIDRDQTVKIGGCHPEVELSTNKTIKESHSMIRIVEVILGEECKVIEVRIL